MKKKYVSQRRFEKFKKLQNENNEKKLASLNDAGVIRSDQLPDSIKNIIAVHLDKTDPTNLKFFEDDNGVNTGKEIIGSKNKLYYDVDSNYDKKYRWTGSNFILVGDNVSIAKNAIHDGDNNKIDETYMKKAEATEKCNIIASKSNFGCIKVGSNFSVDKNGKLFVSKENITNALGYIPLDKKNISIVTDNKIDKMFDL